MAIQISYRNAKSNLAKLCDEASENREIVLIKRPGKEDVALIVASELSSLLETEHLLQSPANAARLMRALKRARARKVRSKPIDALRNDIGIGGRSGS